MGKAIVLTEGKEYIVIRKANRLHECHECHNGIPKGVSYVEDHINYLQRKRDGAAWKKWYTNKICLLCWKGRLLYGGYGHEWHRLSSSRLGIFFQYGGIVNLINLKRV